MKSYLFIALAACLPLLGQTCKEVADNPFPPSILREVLQSYKIPYEAREGVVNRTRNAKSQIHVLVQKRAAAMERNPFDSPVLRIVIGKIEREEGFNFLKKILEKEGIDDPRTQFEIYDEVLNKRAEFLYNCRT